MLLPPGDLVKLIKKLVELLEQKQIVAPRRKVDYVALIGSGKGAFTNDDVFRNLGLPQVKMLSDANPA